MLRCLEYYRHPQTDNYFVYGLVALLLLLSFREEVRIQPTMGVGYVG